MSVRNIDIYLNDHLAGSVAALELLSHLKLVYAGTGREHFLATLHGDIEQDQQELKNIADRLRVTQSDTRNAAAWLAEKVAQFKLWVDDSSTHSSLHWLEALEALAIGIEGKRALWSGLAIARLVPELQGVQFEHLEQRANEQRQQLEMVRLEAVREALWGELRTVPTNPRLP